MRGRVTLGLVALFLLGVPAVRAAPDPMTRQEIIDLAQTGVDYSYWWGHGCWRLDGLEHGSCSGSCPGCTHTGSYGADCSGYVAKVWQVPSPSDVTSDQHPYSTSSFRWNETHWTQISRDDALEADAFVYRNADDTAGHVLLYESGDPWGSIWAYEAKGCSYGIVHNTRTLSSSYVAIRRDLIDEGPQDGAARGVVFEDVGQGTGDMTIRIPGAEVSWGGGSAIASDPDAEWSFQLPPGTYTMTASAAGYLDGSVTCTVLAGQETFCSIGLFAVCEPNCSGRECGPDPVCGESCGTCAGDATCDVNGQCVADCVPDCGDRICGPDPVCGESCGVCPAEHSCTTEGWCVPTSSECIPDCTGRACGPDPVCGESCGICPPHLLCMISEGLCQDIGTAMGKLYGYVVHVPPNRLLPDPESDPPVAGAAVTFPSLATSIRTDRSGYYELQAPPGEHTVAVTADGFASAEKVCTVVAGGSTECHIALHSSSSFNGVQGGCDCRTGGPGSGLIWILVLLGLLIRPRRAERPH